MEQSKRACLSVARSILNHKLIGKKLESYLKVGTSLLEVKAQFISFTSFMMSCFDSLLICNSRL